MMEEPKPRPATVKALAQGVKAACGSMVRQRTCKQSLLGVHMRLPGEDAEVSHGSTSGPDVLSGSSGSESDHRPAFVHSLLTNHTSSGRETRLTPWGPYSVSEWVDMKDGVLTQVGWIANCIQHYDLNTNLKCRKMFRFGTNTSSECRCLCKQWLLMGRHIRSTNPDGRSQPPNT